MATQRKLQGRRPGAPKSPTTEFKKLWRTLSVEAQQYWRDLFVSDAPQSAIREEIASKLNIHFRRDQQITEFRQWIDAEDSARREEEQQQKDAQQILDEHPEWTTEQVRAQVLRQSYLRTLATGDLKGGIEAIKVHTRLDSFRLNTLRMESAVRSEEQKALEFCLEDCKQFPEIEAAFRRAFEMLGRAKRGQDYSDLLQPAK